MPTKHEIVDGPSFKHFFFRSHAIGGSGSLCRFRLRNNPADDRGESVRILVLGRHELDMEDEKNGDWYIFIAMSMASVEKYPYYLVGKYNTTARKGTCVKFEKKEFFDSLPTKTMFDAPL